MKFFDDLIKQYETLVEKTSILAAERKLIVDKALEPVKEELDKLDAQIEQTFQEIEQTETNIKPIVLSAKETLRGNTYMAVWSKGAEHWDTSKLEGFALAHPELLALRTYGEPKVTFRKITKKG